ncbi:hypothetical protein BN8_p06764 (plasmid) [Fibrisoma limi BUZ 3]|uniref:Uncharacterized protein n=1 Tax=Fibrisoma limi BUZ 3 TaxID=1185876 RepID=I2GTX5_9BACT|nr:hypothetical protein [Fibrisoma limi]CCH57576.1 hypothetical protein BN8_p06764 [Fibrisoma limi BUZ 3]
MQLVGLFDEWLETLTKFKNLLIQQVKKHGQNKVLAQIMVFDKTSQQSKPMTRSMYNARLLHSQHWPLGLVEQFAQVLACPELLMLYQKQEAIISQLPGQLSAYIKAAKTSNVFVIHLLGINQATFYAKQKSPKTWQRDELVRIEEIFTTIKSLEPPKK